MKIECPSCHFSTNVDDGKIPPAGGNAKCPRCSTVFFVAPARPIKAEIASETVVCPKCGFGQEAGKTCAKCGIVYKKHAEAEEQLAARSATTAKNSSVATPNRYGAMSPAGPLDLFQKGLLGCGVLGLIYALVRGVMLGALTEQHVPKTGSIIAFLQWHMAPILPSIGIAECIFLIFWLYSFKKRRFSLKVRAGSTPAGLARGDVCPQAARFSVLTVSAFLIAVTALTGVESIYDRSEGAFALTFLSAFIEVPLIGACIIGYAVGKLREGMLFYVLVVVAIIIEVSTYVTMRFFFVTSHTPLFFLHTVKLWLYVNSPVIILIATSYELYSTWKIRQLSAVGKPVGAVKPVKAGNSRGE